MRTAIHGLWTSIQDSYFRNRLEAAVAWDHLKASMAPWIKQALMFSLGLLVGLGGMGIAVRIRHHNDAPPPVMAAALVNHRPLSIESLYNAMFRTCGPQVLDRLVAESVVAQAAAREGVAVTDEELRALLPPVPTDLPPGPRQDLIEQTRCELLLRKLILKDT
ncbi:MAG: hypothetical protein ACYCW6_30260, partial [Candidatus Xenobia bacterium]